MKTVEPQIVQEFLNSKANQNMFLHLETTNGAYAAHHRNSFASGAFIRNATISYLHGKITGTGPYRIGLELEIGWVYAEGLTHFEIDDQGRLIMAGMDYEGKLAVAFELSDTPFAK